MDKTYRIFISHSWSYDSSLYSRILQFFDEQGLSYYNHSVPQNDPIHTNGTDKQLREAIEAKIKGTSCILVLAGVSSSYSNWIVKEIELAKSYYKPIIAVEPWDSNRTSQVVKQNADRTVKWQGKSIVDAIRELG
jgi:hypothetical protein